MSVIKVLEDDGKYSIERIPKWSVSPVLYKLTATFPALFQEGGQPAYNMLSDFNISNFQVFFLIFSRSQIPLPTGLNVTASSRLIERKFNEIYRLPIKRKFYENVDNFG